VCTNCVPSDYEKSTPPPKVYGKLEVTRITFNSGEMISILTRNKHVKIVHIEYYSMMLISTSKKLHEFLQLRHRSYTVY
jgi:hypothetical protein